MKLAVISDTHVDSIDELPGKLLDALEQVDLIVHAGDFTGASVLEGLRKLADVRAVRGNMDYGELARSLPERLVFTIGSKTVGVTHGWGAPWGLAERVSRLFPEADIVIYGHSHRADFRQTGGKLIVNPGPASRSYALIEINDAVTGGIVALGGAP